MKRLSERMPLCENVDSGPRTSGKGCRCALSQRTTLTCQYRNRPQLSQPARNEREASERTDLVLDVMSRLAAANAEVSWRPGGRECRVWRYGQVQFEFKLDFRAGSEAHVIAHLEDEFW